MKKLRLLITKKCNRTCEGCCNKDYDLDALPVITDFTKYDILLITGGEPMLYPHLVKHVCQLARAQNYKIKIIVYTAKTRFIYELLGMLSETFIDGITFTCHDQQDADNLARREIWVKNTSMLRLNVFEGIVLEKDNPIWNNFDIHTGYKWIKNCTLPQGETLGRINWID